MSGDQQGLKATWAPKMQLRFTRSLVGQQSQGLCRRPNQAQPPMAAKIHGVWMAPKTQISSPCVQRPLSKTACCLARKRQKKAFNEVHPDPAQIHILKRFALAQVFQPTSPMKKGWQVCQD